MAAKTLGDWLDARSAPLSLTLENRLAPVLSSHLNEDIHTAAESCITEATVILSRLLQNEQPSRSSPSAARSTAIDLLAADALITLACELASDECDSIDEKTSAWAAHIAQRISDIRDAQPCTDR